MKTIYFSIVLIISLTFTIGCGNKDNKSSEQTQNLTTEQGEVIEIQLPTIQCGTCKKNIESAVKKIDGVTEVKVSVKDKIAKVNYDKIKADVNKIEGAIVMAGYQANDKPADKEAYDKLEKCCQLGGHDE